MSFFEKLNPFEHSGNSHSSSNLFSECVGSFDKLSPQLPGHSALPNDFNGCKIEIILSPQSLSNDGFRQITQFLNELEQGLGGGQNPLQPLDNLGQGGGSGGGFGLPNPMQALDGLTGGAGGGFGLPNPMQALDGLTGGAGGSFGLPNPMQALDGLTGGAGGSFGLPNPMQALDGLTGGAGGSFGLPDPMQLFDGGMFGGGQGGIGIGIPNPMQALEGGLQTGMNATNDVMTGGQDLVNDALSGNPMKLVQDQVKDAGNLLNDLNPMNLLKSIF